MPGMPDGQSTPGYTDVSDASRLPPNRHCHRRHRRHPIQYVPLCVSHQENKMLSGGTLQTPAQSLMRGLMMTSGKDLTQVPSRKMCPLAAAAADDETEEKQFTTLHP
ncbi:unnamed protein product [Pleuronectes platessa]|uniref:Uncharacterized protein n=1 Tax=Pleuronectes platessa TaxID=8262 RepID=A0A9N7VAL0_PLEPL|nr:unnamed protein product [Pleuronectes platessa]